MPTISNDKSRIARCRKSRRIMMNENSNGTWLQTHLSSPIKFLSRSSLLLVSVVISANWMLAEGVSSTSSIVRPSLAPTSSFVANNDAERPESWRQPTTSPTPSLLPTSSSQYRSKKSKIHKKDTSRSRTEAEQAEAPPRSVPNGMETRSGTKRRRFPKKRKSAEPDSETTAAFGLKGRKRPNSSFGHSSSGTEPKLYKSQKTRIRSSSKTRTKAIAFVRDDAIDKKVRKSRNFKNQNSISETSADSKKKKSKSRKRNSRDDTERAGAPMTPKIANSSRTKRSRAKMPPPLNETSSETPRFKTEKSYKKHKKRSKNAVVCDDEATSPERTQLQQQTTLITKVADSTLASQVTKQISQGKLPKRKRRKKDGSSSPKVDEGFASSTLHTSNYDDSIKSSANSDANGTDAKRMKRSKRLKKSVLKSGEIDSSPSIDKDEVSVSTTEVQLPSDGTTIQSMEEGDIKDDVIDASESKERLIDESPNEESSVDAGGEDSRGSIDDSVHSIETSVDNSATLEVQADINEEREIVNAEEAVLTNETTNKEYNDVAECVENTPKDTITEDNLITPLENEEEVTVGADNSQACDEVSPELHAEQLDKASDLDKGVVDKDSVDIIEEKEKGSMGETLSNTDVEIVVDKSNIIGKNVYNDNDDMSKLEEEQIEIDQEDTDSAIIGKEDLEEGTTTDEKAREEEKADYEREDSNIQDGEEADIVSEKNTEADSLVITNGFTTEGNNIDEESDDRAKIVEEESSKDGLNIYNDEPTIDEKHGDSESEDTNGSVDTDNRTDVVREEISNDNQNRVEDDIPTEGSVEELEMEETDESENGDNHGSDNHDTLEVFDEENETSLGVSVQHSSILEISSSEESDFDPEQDVVSFIEGVLQENVRSWIEESDSHVENIVNKTRGGHTDDENKVDEKVLGSESIDDDKEPDECPNNVVSETSEIVEDDSKEITNNTIRSIKKTEDEFGIIDRESLEKLEDKNSDAVVSIVTWNLAEDSPSERDAAFIRKFRKNGISAGQGSDLVLISGQECENIKPRRSEGRRSREYRRLMIKMLGEGYVPLALHLLGGIQFGLFAKRSFLDEIEDVSVADVTCGIGNVFHNKGAIAAFLKVKARNEFGNDKGEKRSKSLRMVFVTAHLAAHVKNVEARDSDFWRISSELEAQAPEGFLPRKPSNMDSSGSFLFDSVDRVFFCGDLNYRADLPRELTEHNIVHKSSGDESSIKNLLRHDQLTHSMAEGRAFPRFGEGKIAFMPTFKYDKESASYDTSHKQRIPAWTDRVLFQPTDGIRVLDYQSVPSAQSSDHRPVYGTYRICMEGRILAPSTRKRKRKRFTDYIDSNY